MRRDVSGWSRGEGLRPGLVGAGLCGLALLPAAGLARRYGRAPAARFAAAAGGAILLQQALASSPRARPRSST
jgi:hypothetical protein